MNNQIEVFYMAGYKTSACFWKNPDYLNSACWATDINNATHYKSIDEIKLDLKFRLDEFNIIKVEVTKTIIDINKIANQKLEDISN